MCTYPKKFFGLENQSNNWTRKRKETMSQIISAQLHLPSSSKFRTKKRMSQKALRQAFMDGADFFVMSSNGRPYQTYCSCRDFAEGASVEMVEDGESVDYFTYKPSIDPQENDIPVFANGHNIELD